MKTNVFNFELFPQIMSKYYRYFQIIMEQKQYIIQQSVKETYLESNVKVIITHLEHPC